MIRTDSIVNTYSIAKYIVETEGFSEEIEWQRSVRFADVDEQRFLRELSWVIVSSGFSERIARRVFSNISPAYFNWQSSSLIADNAVKCLRRANRIFHNDVKNKAIVKSAAILATRDYPSFKAELIRDPIHSLQVFPYIGPATSYHLAKNIGLDVAKPDRHLKRIANAFDYSDVQKFCEKVSEMTGDPIPVIDIVLWRFATIEPSYLRNIEQWIEENEGDYESLPNSHGG